MNDNLLHSFQAWFSQPMIDLLGWSLVHFLWQGSVLALLLAMLLFALRNATASIRYVTACAGLLLMAVCPLITLAWTWGRTGETASTAERLAAAQPIVSRAHVDVAGQKTPLPPTSNRMSAEQQSMPTGREALPVRPSTRIGWGMLQTLLPWFVGAWLVGVIALSVRLFAGWLWLQQMWRRRARPVTAEWDAKLRHLAKLVRVSRPVRLLESAILDVPAVIGALRPVILVPTGCLIGLSMRQLEAILAHELAHIRRHDYLVNLLQTALETLLFYHPAVWWVSDTIRAEREACCDEIATEVCSDRLEYAQALTFMEELRGSSRQLAVAASGGPLSNRIQRLMGLPAAQSNRSAWWLMAAVAVGVLAMFFMNGAGNVHADSPTDKPDTASGAKSEDWGTESGGLRCRLVTVPSDTNDESPEVTKTTNSFANGNDVTFVVELKNVSDKPVTLLGVRYGDSYGASAGKLNASYHAPYLFELAFTDSSGQTLPRAKREFVGGPMFQFSGASAHEIAPGKSLSIALRPAKFNSPMEFDLPPGDYKAQIRYQGPTDEVIAKIKKHWPDKPQAKAWSGEVVSNIVSFNVAKDPNATTPSELRWCEPKAGLQAAAEFNRPRNASPSTDPPGTFPLNSRIDVTFHLKNVSEHPISLVSETWRQDDQATATNEAGEEKELKGTRYTGWPIMVRWILQPGEIAELKTPELGVAADDEATKKFEHTVGKRLIAAPGKYLIRYTIRLGSIQSRDDKGNVVLPANTDWQGELVTAETPLVVRARTAEDDAQEQAGHFVGRIEFVAKDGRPIEAGSFTARASGRRRDAASTAIHAGPLEIADCSSRPLSVTVYAPGYEEARFDDVQLKANETKRFELTPAAPTRFRLISTVDGKPVVGAKVRYFTRIADLTGGGPIPMYGIEGPIWATSRADGMVVLDMLRKIDPNNAKLGDSIYAFYIEPPNFAPQFLGGVKAGADLGDVRLGLPLEVRGEVQGTPEELKRFAAEWDQPFAMPTTARPNDPPAYAVSQRLETKRDGDKLTFHLTGLREGKLRIISNFGPYPHSVSHTYGRRDPKRTDVLVEVDLKDSLSDLVITPTGRKAK